MKLDTANMRAYKLWVLHTEADTTEVTRKAVAI